MMLKYVPKLMVILSFNHYIGRHRFKKTPQYTVIIRIISSFSGSCNRLLSLGLHSLRLILVRNNAFYVA